MLNSANGPLKEQLQNHDDIKVIDFVQPEEFENIIKQSGCLLLPSIKEPWALVLHEFSAAGLHGKPVDTLSVGALSPELGLVVGVHLLIYDLDDLRGALRPDVRGRSPRGDAAAVRQLLEPDL